MSLGEIKFGIYNKPYFTKAEIKESIVSGWLNMQTNFTWLSSLKLLLETFVHIVKYFKKILWKIISDFKWCKIW